MTRPQEWLSSTPEGAAEQANDVQWPALLPCDWLFTASAEAMLIVDAATGKVVEVNPSAAAIFRTPCTRLLGMELPAAFEVASAATVEACLVFARVLGSAESACVRALSGSEMKARLSLFRAPPGAYLLVRLSANDPAATNSKRGSLESVVFKAIDSANVGFLMADVRFQIEYANRTFIEMVDQASPADVQGSSIARWLLLTEPDLARLRLQLSQRRAASHLTARLCAAHNRTLRVAVCAVAVPAGQDSCWGFSIYELPFIH